MSCVVKPRSVILITSGGMGALLHVPIKDLFTTPRVKIYQAKGVGRTRKTRVCGMRLQMEVSTTTL
jgi:hypothetical protein